MAAFIYSRLSGVDPSTLPLTLEQNIGTLISGTWIPHSLEARWGMCKAAAYFVTLMLASCHVLLDVYRSYSRRRTQTKHKESSSSTSYSAGVNTTFFLLVLFGLYSIATSWDYILEWWLVEDRGRFSDDEAWLAESEWLTGAYRLVTGTPHQWFCSSQLLQFSCSMVVFVYVESYRCSSSSASSPIRPLSSVWAACAGAVSFALPMFLAVVVITPKIERLVRWEVPPNTVLIFCVILASLAITILPRTDGVIYHYVLYTIHLCVAVPVLVAQFFPSYSYRPAAPNKGSTRSIAILNAIKSQWITGLYFILAGTALSAHLHNCVALGADAFTDAASQPSSQPGQPVPLHAVFGVLFQRLASAFCLNSCQCSISWDLVNNTVLLQCFFLVFGGKLCGFGTRSLLALLTPFVGVGVTFPVWAGIREWTSAEYIVHIALAQQREADKKKQ